MCMPLHNSKKESKRLRSEHKGKNESGKLKEASRRSYLFFRLEFPSGGHWTKWKTTLGTALKVFKK